MLQVESHIAANQPASTTALPIIIRTTAFILLLKFFILELTFSVFFLTFVLFFSSFIHPLIPFNTLTVYVLGYIGISGFKSFLMFFSIALWVRNYYELSRGMIIYKSGILKRHSHSFKLESITALDIDQSFFGRMFNYGTIELEHPFIRQHFFLSNVPNPQKVLRLIRDSTLDGELTLSRFS